MRDNRLLLLPLLLALSAHAATLVRIQCGGPGGKDAQGNVWKPDAYFTGGARWDTTNQATMATLPVPYKTLRYSAYPAGSPVSYTIPMSPGIYTVTLKFLEPNKTAIGQRVFSVAVNGALHIASLDLSSLDLFAVAPGALTPYSESFPVVITGPLLLIVLTASQGNAVISGIQIDDDTVPPVPPTYAPYLTGLESAPPLCPASGLTFFLATDTGHLFWCFAGSDWKVVGDVRNASPPLPSLVGIEQCVGSGPGWDCAGLLRATIRLPDGSLLPLIGISMVLPDGVTIWTAK
jgi:hypothetical protein